MNELVAAADVGSSHILEPVMRSLRALMRLARGDDAGATEDAATALERRRSLTDAQLVDPFRNRAWVATGDRGLARALVEEVGLDRLAERSDNEFHVQALLQELGLSAEYLEVAETRTSENRPLRQAAIHFLHGDYVRAADLYAASGDRTDEAYARLRAARAFAAEGRRVEADAELQQALAFYRSVGATRYIREAEALLAATA